MPWRDALEPARMERIAVVAPADRLRRVLVALGSGGLVELELLATPGGPAEAALQRVQARSPGGATTPVV